MQTFFPGWLYEANLPDNRLPPNPPCLISGKIFKEDFNPYLQEVIGRGERKEVNDYGAIQRGICGRA